MSHGANRDAITVFSLELSPCPEDLASSQRHRTECKKDQWGYHSIRGSAPNLGFETNFSLLQAVGVRGQAGDNNVEHQRSQRSREHLVRKSAGARTSTRQFNAAHFVAFEGYRERLHGHNYHVSVRLIGAQWRRLTLYR